MTLKQLITKNKRNLSLFLLSSLGEPVINLLLSYCLSLAIMVLDANSNQEVYILIGTIVGIVLFQIILSYLTVQWSLPLVTSTMSQLKGMIFKNIMNQDLEGYANREIDEYKSWLTSDVQNFETTFFSSVQAILSSIWTFILGGAILLYINVWVGSLMILFIIILALIMRFYEKPVILATQDTMEANTQYHKQISNILNGLEVISLHGAQNRFKIPFFGIAQKQEATKIRNYFLDKSQKAIADVFVSFSQLTVVLLAVYLFIKGSMDLTQVIFIFNVSGQILWTSVGGISLINTLISANEIYKKIITESKPEVRTKPFTFEEEISIQDLKISYGANTILENFSADIQPGSKVLIYGPSGTGKTSLLNCLSQTKTDFDGYINYDDTEIKEINSESFLDKCGYIRQTHFMFEDSIVANVILKEKYDEEKFFKIMEEMNLLEWINSLEDKENHILVDNGNNISGGQRQRLSIARELYHDCDVLFVDEPSASLDDVSSKKVYDSLLNLKQTVLCVSHRHLDYLSSKFDDVIYLGEEA